MIAYSRLIIACVLAAGLVACSQSQHNSSPQDTATAIAQALYNNDYNGVIANFDDTLKGQATRTQVAMISDKMHSLGDFQGLSATKSDDDTRRYVYDAKFSKGDMTVELRLHANGQVAAYRIIPK
ncbi:MAG TPA: hypothetical protein VKF82_04185 [Candidatus Eremiobacteraceae bacterium]|nr:hypothetical protein [Candidatus Eremiobacteraceae bacterium]